MNFIVANEKLVFCFNECKFVSNLIKITDRFYAYNTFEDLGPVVQN